MAYAEDGLARLEDRWAGRGVPGTKYLDPSHLYAADLDLFGAGSLYERLCIAATAAGRSTLADWLLRPAPREEIEARQQAVREWTPSVRLREEVALIGAEIAGGIDLAALSAWGQRAAVNPSRAARVAVVVLGTVNLLTLLGWLALGSGVLPFLIACLISTPLAAWWRPRVKLILADLERRSHELALLSRLFERFERESMRAEWLLGRRSRLVSDGEPPSRRIGRLTGLLDRLEWGRNQLVAPFSALALARMQIAFGVDRWRAREGPLVAGWIAVLADYEALASMATYAFENPGNCYPVTDSGGVLLDLVAMGHPLLPEASCVRNDLRLDGRCQVLVVSGSNMSGKSTFLRAAGVNLVLAQAGAPVRAEAMRFSPLAIGASLRIQDSLQEGRSRFFAEITRVKEVVQAARTRPPLLFLLDELLSGTNSHDRRLGAEGIVRGLLDLGAIGLVTTHDLALAEIADALAPRAANVHFEDRFENGEMTFDYKVRPGVVRHSNALALMRSVGLDV